MDGHVPMMVGTVQPNGDATVAVRIRGTLGTAELHAVVDTGFNDWLALSPASIASLGLVFREHGRYTLADGSESVTRVFAGEIEWLGRWRRILIVEMGGDPLIGMAMLRGTYLGIEVIDGGRVEIRPLCP